MKETEKDIIKCFQRLNCTTWDLWCILSETTPSSPYSFTAIVRRHHSHSQQSLTFSNWQLAISQQYIFGQPENRFSIFIRFPFLSWQFASINHSFLWEIYAHLRCWCWCFLLLLLSSMCTKCYRIDDGWSWKESWFDFVSNVLRVPSSWLLLLFFLFLSCFQWNVGYLLANIIFHGIHKNVKSRISQRRALEPQIIRSKFD